MTTNREQIKQTYSQRPTAVLQHVARSNRSATSDPSDERTIVAEVAEEILRERATVQTIPITGDATNEQMERRGYYY